MVDDLGLLADLRGARRALDEQELRLIERTRHGGATWEQIALALGLASRQAAQQRHQRLIAAARSRLQEQDRRYAPGIAALRRAVTDLYRWIEVDRGWDGRFPRAALVRQTLSIAVTAPPGALHALATHIEADLREAPVPDPVRGSAARLRSALSTSH